MTAVLDPPTVDNTDQAHIPLDHLIAAEDNLRRKVDEDKDAFKMLAASIAADGVLVPLTVTPASETNKFLVVAGHRRLVAAKKVGLEAVPCLIRAMTDEQRIVAMIVENLARVDLDPLEEASGYFRAIELGMKQKDLAARVGRTAAHITRRLQLLELPSEVQKQVSSGDVTLESAAELAKIVKAGTLEASEIAEIADARDVEYEAKRMLKKREDDAKIAQRVEALLAKGVKAQPAVDHWGHRDDGWKKVGDIYGGMNLDKKAHRKEPCCTVEVSIGYNGVAETDYCKEPKRHTKAGASALKVERPKPSDAEQARRAREKERAEAKLAARSTIIDGAKKWGPLPTEHVEELAMLIFQSIDYNQHETICLTLDIEPEIKVYKSYSGKPTTKKEWVAPLAKWVDADRKGRALKLLWAVLLCNHRTPLSTLMKFGGYEPDDQERRWELRSDAEDLDAEDEAESDEEIRSESDDEAEG